MISLELAREGPVLGRTAVRFAVQTVPDPRRGGW
jgi:hypothetical protein